MNFKWMLFAKSSGVKQQNGMRYCCMKGIPTPIHKKSPYAGLSYFIMVLLQFADLFLFF